MKPYIKRHLYNFCNKCANRCYVHLLFFNVYLHIYRVLRTASDFMYLVVGRLSPLSLNPIFRPRPCPPPLSQWTTKEDLCVIMYQYLFTQGGSMRFSHPYQYETVLAANRYTSLPDRVSRRTCRQCRLLRNDTTTASYYQTSVRAASLALCCRAIYASADSDCDRDRPPYQVISYDLPFAFWPSRSIG